MTSTAAPDFTRQITASVHPRSAASRSSVAPSSIVFTSAPASISCFATAVLPSVDKCDGVFPNLHLVLNGRPSHEESFHGVQVAVGGSERQWCLSMWGFVIGIRLEIE
jgi:hypothetical protein